MKQTKTTLKELTAAYRAVLRHGILCNAIALGLIAAAPAMADMTPAENRLVITDGQSVEQENISWSGFSGSTYGGAAENSGTIVATNVEFKNNTAGSMGGAIDNFAGTLTINGASNFSGNTANGTGSFGGAIDNYKGILTINNGVAFNTNSATNGGAISNVKDTGVANATISGATFTGNTATAGGALYDAATSTITGVENVDTFKQNSAENGGAIFIATTGNTTVNDATFTGNTATNLGGAIYNKGILSLTNSTFNGNDATDKAGAVYNLGTLTVTGSTFDGNNSGQSGAISDNTEATGGMTITNSTFKNNTATVGSGAIGIFSGHGTTLNNVEFKSNSAGEAGAVFVGAEATANIINGSVFDSNTATTVGGAIATRSVDAGTNSEAKLDIVGATFKGNSAGTTGGAIDNNFYNSVGHAGSVYVSGSTFGGANEGDGNSAVNGGAIYNHANATQTGNMYIADTTFTGNTASGKGGAVYNEGIMTLSNAIFGGAEGGNSAEKGGAILNTGTLTLNGGTFTGNRSTGVGRDAANKEMGGGAIYSDQSTSLTSISGATFTGNISDYIGGAVYIYSGTAEIDNTVFEGNSASWGGAVFTRATPVDGHKISDLTITNSEFNSNTAKGTGALGIMRKGIITDTDFTGNQATDATDDGAGALFLGAESYTTLTRGTFEDNTSAAAGGAIGTRDFVQGNNVAAKLDINGTTFNHNTAATTGGAIDNYFYNDDAGDGYVSVNDATFTENSAASGGAIYNHKNATQTGNMNITDTTFTDNTASDKGGAIFNEGTLTVAAENADVAFTGNTANGSANDIYNVGTLNLNAADGKTISLAGGIDGAAGTLNIVGNGLVETSTIKNQTVAHNAGELHLTTTEVDGANLAGSTVTVADGATINTIDNLINNYKDGGAGKGTITLSDGANIKGDIDFENEVADMYAADTDATVNYKVGNLLGCIGKGTKEIQVVSNGATVDISEAHFTSENGASFVSSGTNDGKMKVQGFEGGIADAADASATVDNVMYKLTENESLTTNKTMQHEFVLTGAGTEAADEGLELAANLQAAEGATVEINDLKLSGSGKLVNNGFMRINDSFVDVDVDTSGVFLSDPTTYTGTVTNTGFASFDEDTFTSTAVLANSGNVSLANGVTFDTGATITGAGTTNLVGGIVHFNNTANANTINVASGANFDGKIIGGKINTQNGIIDTIAGSIQNMTDVALDVNTTSGTTDSFAGVTGSTIKSLNVMGNYGTTDKVDVTIDSGLTLDSGAEINGGYYTKVEQSGSTLTFSDKLINESGLYTKLGAWTGGNYIKANADFDNPADADHLTVGQALSALDTGIGAKIASDGNYIKASTTNSVNQNISALDTQLKTVSTAGTIASGQTGFVTGDAVHTALSDKQDTLTSDQLAAANSGITATKVGTYDGYAATIAGKADAATTLAGYGITDAYTQTQVDTKLADKQDNLTTAQLAAANSGITATKVGTYDDVAAAVNHATTGLAATKAIADANAAAIATHGNIVTHNVAEFATSGQGAKADTAIQGVQVNGADLTPNASNIVNVTVASGSANGTIAVNGVDVAVTGLGTAAYEAATAFDTAGAAAAVDAKLGTGFSSTDTVAAALALKQDAISDTATIAADGTGFSVVDGSIGTTQLSTAVNASLGAADSAIQGVKVNGTALTPDAGNVVDITMTETADAGALHTAIAGIMGGSDSAKDKRTALGTLLTTGTYASQNLTSVSTAEAVASYMQLSADIMSEYDFGWDLNAGLQNDLVGGKYKIDVLNDTGVTDHTVAGAINANTAAMTVASDGNYITAGHDVAANLGALDTQAKANADDINEIVSGATIVAKAYGDEDGNNIKATYATKTEVTTGVTAVYNQAHNWAENLLGLDVDENVEDQLQHGLAALGGTNNIAADTITGALHELDTEKAGLDTDNTFTGENTFQNANGINIANAGGTITANMKAGTYDGHDVLAITGVDGVTAGAFVATGDGFMTEHFTANDTEIELTNGSDAVMFSVDNTGDMTVAGDASIGGDLNVTGGISAATLATTGDATVGGDLNVTGDTTLTGLLTANGGITTTTLTTSGDASVGGDLAVTGDTTLTGLLTANGGITTTTLTTSGDASVGGDLAVTGDISGATLTTTGDATVGGDLNVTGDTTLTGLLTANGGITTTTVNATTVNAGANGTSLTDGSLVLNDGTNTATLTATSAGLNVAEGFAVATDKLIVDASGNTSVAGTLGTAGDFAVNTNKFTVAAATGNTSVGGTLNVAGNTTLNGSLGFGGAETVNAIDDGTTAQTTGGANTLSTVATVLKSAENAAFTGTQVNGATGTTTVGDALSATNAAIGDMNSLAGHFVTPGATIAANLDQLSNAIDGAYTYTDQRVESLSKEMSAGVAGAVALSSVAVSGVERGEVSVGAGYGHFNGQSAAAFGATMGLTNNWSVNAGAGISNADVSFRAGTNYKFKLF